MIVKTMMVTFYWIPSAAIDGSTAYAQPGNRYHEFVVGKEWWPQSLRKRGRPGGPRMSGGLGFAGAIFNVVDEQLALWASSWARFNVSSERRLPYSQSGQAAGSVSV